MTVELVPSLPRHLGHIARHMREIDRRECLAMGHAPKAALRHARRVSLWSLTAIRNGEPIALMGLAALNLVEGVGVPFFLGTDAVYGCGRELIRKGPAVIGHMLKATPVLVNLVSCENDRAIRLLKRWGFAVEQEKEMHGGLDFVPFRMVA